MICDRFPFSRARIRTTMFCRGDGRQGNLSVFRKGLPMLAKTKRLSARFVQRDLQDWAIAQGGPPARMGQLSVVFH